MEIFYKIAITGVHINFSWGGDFMEVLGPTQYTVHIKQHFFRETNLTFEKPAWWLLFFTKIRAAFLHYLKLPFGKE